MYMYINAGTSKAEMASETNSQPQQGQVSMLQSQEMNSTVQYIQLPNFRLVLAYMPQGQLGTKLESVGGNGLQVRWVGQFKNDSHVCDQWFQWKSETFHLLYVSFPEESSQLHLTLIFSMTRLIVRLSPLFTSQHAAIFTGLSASNILGHLVVCVSRKHMPACIMH